MVIIIFFIFDKMRRLSFLSYQKGGALNNPPLSTPLKYSASLYHQLHL